MARREPCPICRSRKWRKQPQSGIITCGEGHILADYRVESNDATEYGQHTLRKRTLKSTKVKKEKKSNANPILYHGERGRYHYFQCLQVLLRMQIQKLTELWQLPPEFEIVCRDTWALHLSLLTSPPPLEPLLHSQEQDGPPVPGVSVVEKGPEKKQIEESDDEDENASVMTGSDSSSPDDEGESEVDSDMDELLREASEVEYSEAEEGGGKQRPHENGTSLKPKRPWRRDDSPAATICVLVHSCWFMRIPIMYNDLVCLIETYTLPYLDPLRLLPLSLTRHLTKNKKQALSPHGAPTPTFLHGLTSRLSKLCFERYGIFTPELNAPPILWRCVQHMGGTPTLYTMAKALARYLQLPLTLNSALAPPALKEFSNDPKSHKSDNVPSEVALVATVVIALKLIYGLDEKEVHPEEDWDPSHAMPALDAYILHLRTMQTSDVKSTRTRVSPPFMADVQNEPEEDLDTYLDFCERALLDRASASGAENSDLVADYFPLKKQNTIDEVTQSVLDVTQSADDDENDDTRPVLAAIHAASGESISAMVRPGEWYAIFSAQDIFGRLPEKYAIVLDRAALWTGVSDDDLSAVVERFERRLVRLWKRSKRRERMKRESESESEEDDEENAE